MEGLCEKCQAKGGRGAIEPDAPTDTSESLILASLVNIHSKCAEVLIKAGADAQLPLFFATLSGYNDCVKLLVEAGAEVNFPTATNNTPIIVAARTGYIHCLQTLIEAGADVNTGDSFDKTPVMLAASGGHIDCVQTLIEAGADVNTGDRFDKTPVMSAAGDGHIDCVQTLIEAGADVNSQDDTGYSALSYAVKKGCFQCAEVLLKSGAVLNHDGQSPIALATDYRCLDLLLKAGADVNARDQDDSPVITNLAERGNYECLKLMLRVGADVNFMDAGAMDSPLYSLMYYPKRINTETRLKCIKLLLRAGAKVNAFKNLKVVERYESNALRNYIFQCASSGVQPDEVVCMLLYAAGETVDGETVVGTTIKGMYMYRFEDVHIPLPEYLLHKELKLCLKHLCRNVIRNHIISLDPQNHLFNRIPQLGLPSSLTEYLLYNMSLHDDDDEDNRG